MDAAKGLGATAIKGQGRPLYADPRSNDSVHELCRRQGRMSGLDLLAPLGAIAKRDSPVRGETKTKSRLQQVNCTAIQRSVKRNNGDHRLVGYMALKLRVAQSISDQRH